MTQKEHKAHQIVFTILGALCSLMILYSAFAIFIDGQVIRRPMIVYDQKPGIQMQTDKLVYEQGETVYGLIKYCKNRNIPATFQWTLIDGYLKFFASKTTNVAPGCHEVLTEIETIPRDQYPDTDLYFETVLHYRINSFNEVDVVLRTNTFRVR